MREKRGMRSRYLELDNKFHEILYEASESPVLKHTLSDFHHYVQRVRKITLADPKRAVASNEEHRKIVEALKAKDEQKSGGTCNDPYDEHDPEHGSVWMG